MKYDTSQKINEIIIIIKVRSGVSVLLGRTSSKSIRNCAAGTLAQSQVSPPSHVPITDKDTPVD